jgi:hypothetical protein
MEKKTLFAVAVERCKRLTKRGNPVWRISVSYLQAMDVTEAQFLYRAGNTQEIVNFEVYCSTNRVSLPMRKVISIGPAVGHFLENEKTGELSAD